MLQDLAAALFLVGISVALARSKKPAYSLLPLGLVIMLLPGILSLDFEAPQFYRTIGVIPIVLATRSRWALPSRLPWSLAGWSGGDRGWAGSARRRRRGDWLLERFDVLDSPGDGFCRLDGFLDSGDDRRPRDRSIGNKDRLLCRRLYNNTPTQQFSRRT